MCRYSSLTKMKPSGWDNIFDFRQMRYDFTASIKTVWLRCFKKITKKQEQHLQINLNLIFFMLKTQDETTKFLQEENSNFVIISHRERELKFYGWSHISRRKARYTRQVSSMIHSARPIVSPVADIVFLLFCFSRFEKWGRTDVRTTCAENDP